ncbi:MAG: PhzF family phenazine biosynthesis protein [Clostridiaceae bacterium]
MKKLRFKKIDAFTTGISSGNPAGYIYMDSNEILNEEEMQRVALELKGFVNEVGYVSKVGNQYKLRYFSSECEVAFCGHATIAIMYDLLSNSKDLLDEREVFINVKAGTLSVFNHIREEDAAFIMAPAPKFLQHSLKTEKVADILGINSSEINDAMPVRLIDGGLRTLIVPLCSLQDCLKVNPHQENLRLFCLKNEIDIVLIFVDETHTESSKYRTRVFAPKFGYLEDLATGSGNSAFGYYLIDENKWDDDFTIEQGPDKINPNFVKIKRFSAGGKESILFGGCAKTRIEGHYILY